MAEQSRIVKSGGPRRPYTMRKRAAAMERTRERITRAAVELHETIGPAATTMSAVAQRAGITRATLYRHYPDEVSLFAACSADWLGSHPRPQPSALEPGPPPARLTAALDTVYGDYRANARMRANLLRDAEVFPSPIAEGIRSYPQAFVDALAPEWGAGGDDRSVRAALALAFSFETWRLLADRGLSDAAARTLLLELVAAAARAARAGGQATTS